MSRLFINNKTLYKFALGLLIIFFVLFYFSDGLGKILYRSGSGFYRYSAILKGFFEIFVLAYSLITLKKQKAYVFIAILLLVSCFLIGQFFLSLKFSDLNFAENFNSLFKYLFPFIIYLLAIDVLIYNKYSVKLFKYYKLIIIINGILIGIGLLLEIDYLKTYTGVYRFGYNGLIFAQNEASFIFIFALATIYYRRFYLNIKEYFFWIVLISSLFVATKAVYLFIALLLVFHLFKRVSLKNIIAFGIFIAAGGYFLFSNIINSIIMNSWNVFLYYYRRDGLISASLNGRDTFLREKLEPLIFDYWSLPNIFFGGQDVVSHYIEMGLIDLFLFFGAFGFVLYFYFYYKLFNLLSFNKYFKIYFGLSLLFIIATAGHFFESGIVGLHFIIIILISKKHNEINKAKSFKNKDETVN